SAAGRTNPRVTSAALSPNRRAACARPCFRAANVILGRFDDSQNAHRDHEPFGQVGRVSPLRAVFRPSTRGAHGVRSRESSATYNLVGTGHFDTDGKLDWVWRSKTGIDLAAWYIKDRTLLNSTSLMAGSSE